MQSSFFQWKTSCIGYAVKNNWLTITTVYMLIGNYRERD